MNNGYSLCLNEWALDLEIKNELNLLLIISSLCAEKGYCWATNKYFSELFNETEISISRKIKKLESKGYLTIEYKKRGCEIIERNLRLTKLLIDDKQKNQSTINKNVKENNIITNNTSINNNIKEIIKEKYYENDKLNSIFLEFLQIRKKMKAVNSEIAITKLLNILSEYDDGTKYKMIEQSIINSWKGIFPLKQNAKKGKTSEAMEVLKDIYNGTIQF